MSGASSIPPDLKLALEKLESRFSGKNFRIFSEGNDADGCDLSFSVDGVLGQKHARFSSSALEQKIQVLQRRAELSYILDLESCTFSDSLDVICRDMGCPCEQAPDSLLKIESLSKGKVGDALKHLKECVDALAPESSMAEDVELAASELLMNAFSHSRSDAKMPSLNLYKTVAGNVLLSVCNEPKVFSRTGLLERWKELSSLDTRLPRSSSANDQGAGVGLYSLLSRVSHLGFAELRDGRMEVSVLFPISKRQIVRAHGNISLTFVKMAQV